MFDKYQGTFAVPRQPPVCLTHQVPTKYDHIINNSQRAAVFLCPRGCQVVAPAPDCAECGAEMHFRWSKERTYYWRCDGRHRAAELEICDCGGSGWLHMDNRNECGHDPHNEKVLGFVCGQFIDRCDGCGHYRFADPIQAERMHRRECGCGHGLPNNHDAFQWVDYGGRNGEVYNAMVAAGFGVTVTDSSEGEDFRTIEVYIPEGEADKFIATLDGAYDKIKAPTVVAFDTETVRKFSRNETGRSLDDEVTGIKPGELLQLPRVGGERKTGYNGFWQSRMSPACQKEIRAMADQIAKESSTMPPQVPVITTGRTSTKDPNISNPPRPAERPEVVALETASYNLLKQLNEMRFDDHAIKDQRRLESRRRELLASLSDMEKLKINAKSTWRVEDHTSQGRDRLQLIRDDKLPLAGGYRIENLHKLDDENVLFGRAYLDGDYHHVTFIEVQDMDGEQQPVNDPHRRYYDGVGQFNDEAMKTVRVPGFIGNYVLFIYPSAR